MGGVRGRRRAVAAAALVWAACSSPDTVAVPDHGSGRKSSAEVRADRRAYDGAPPVIPHASYGAECANCHNERGRSVSGVGFAPASPHDHTPFVDGTVRCRQCHVFRTTETEFVASDFSGLSQALSAGDRATPGAPPRIPHRILMREHCLACHDGPGAREAIRTTHPERARCRQCHVPIETLSEFRSEADPVDPDVE
jgi:cytochrome c-type protein NapB